MIDGHKRKVTLLNLGILSVLLGITMILFHEKIVFSIFSLWSVVVIISGCLTFFQIPFNSIRQNRQDSSVWSILLQGAISIAFGLFLFRYAREASVSLGWFLAAYFFLLGLISFLNYFLLFRNRVEGRGHTLFDALVFMGLGLLSWGHLKIQNFDVYGILGIYVLFYGITLIRDSMLYVTYTGKGRKRRFHMTLPVLVSAFVPSAALNSVNRLLNKNRVTMIEMTKEKDTHHQPEIEVWIHTAHKGLTEMAGHVDISYNGLTYAYGQYDVDTAHLGGIWGDGVFWTIPTSQYQEMLEKDKERATFVYGIQLTEDECQLVEQQIKKLMMITKPFTLESPAQKESYLGKIVADYPDVQAYKFTRSQFKTYFVMTTNCVLLSDYVIGPVGIDMVGINGIMTPGAYLEYFEGEFQNPYSKVITKRVLGQQETEK